MSLLRLSRLAPLLAVTLLLAMWSSPMTATGSPAHKRFHCGNQCNGKKPGYVVPSNGVRCSASKRRIATRHPRGDGFADKGVTVRTYYSQSCQTLWETIHVARGGPGKGKPGHRLNCRTEVSRTVSAYTHFSVCPHPGHTGSTVMVNDYVSGHGTAAYTECDTVHKGDSVYYQTTTEY